MINKIKSSKKLIKILGNILVVVTINFTFEASITV